MREMADKAKKEYQVKCTSVNQNMNGLSGGNKQKVNLGRWLLKDLQLLIVDCPTRGVDIGVKAYIYHVMQEAKKKGLTIVILCVTIYSNKMALKKSDMELLLTKDAKDA